MRNLFDDDVLYVMDLMKLNNNKIKFIEKKYDGKLFYINVYLENYHYSIYFLKGLERFENLMINKKYSVKEMLGNGNDY